MASTFYDSQLTAEEIEAALEAINGLIASANNGKVVAVEDGELVAKSVTEYTGSAVLEPLSVYTNGDYTPGSGVDGFDSVHVEVTPNLQSKTATENGTVTPDTGYDGLSSVVVNVSGGGGGAPVPLIVTASSTYSSSPKQPSFIFGDIADNFWGAGARSGWLNINFTTPFVLKKIRLANYYRVSSSTYWYSSSIIVRASNDGFATYTDLYTGTELAQSDTQFEIDLDNSTPYTEYRFIVSDSVTYVGLGRVTLVADSGGGSKTTAFHIVTASTSGANASVSVQKGTYDFESSTPFTPTGESETYLFQGSVYTENNIDDMVSLDSYVNNSYNWGIKGISGHTIYVLNEGVFAPGTRAKTWYYNTTVDFYVLFKLG